MSPRKQHSIARNAWHAHNAQREAIGTFPRLQSVRLLYVAQRRRERIARPLRRIACALAFVAAALAPSVIFILATNR